MKDIVIDKSRWKKIKLGDIAEDISVRIENPSDSEFDRFVGLEHFISGDLKIKNWSTTENLVSSTKAFKSGDILFARRNAYLRRASLVEFDGVCSGDAFVLRENNSKIIPGFLAFIVNSERLWDYANSNAAGTMSKRVKWRDLSNFEFHLPPINHQKKIAELLWQCDHMLQVYFDLKEQLYNLYNIFHNEYFVLDNFQYIDSIATKVGSGKTPLGGDKNYKKTGVRFIRSQNIHERRMDFEDIVHIDESIHEEMKNSKVYEGDVLLNITGASIGRCAVYLDKGMEANVNQHVCIIRVNKYDPKILCEFLNSKFGQEQIRILQTGGNREGLNFQNIRQFKVPNLNANQQVSLNKKFELLDKNVKNIEINILGAKKIFNKILHSIMQ